MKNLLTPLIYLLTLSQIIAQPSITTDWFYSAGDTVKTYYYYPEELEMPNEGIDMIWESQTPRLLTVKEIYFGSTPLN